MWLILQNDKPEDFVITATAFSKTGSAIVSDMPESNCVSVKVKQKGIDCKSGKILSRFLPTSPLLDVVNLWETVRKRNVNWVAITETSFDNAKNHGGCRCQQKWPLNVHL